MNTLSTKNTRRIFAALLSAACLLRTTYIMRCKAESCLAGSAGGKRRPNGVFDGLPDRPRNVPAGYARRAERNGAVGTARAG